MPPKILTSIYLTPAQKRALARRAKHRRTSMSEEIRIALDKHLQGKQELDEVRVSFIAGKANKAVDRMVRKLSETNALLVNLRRRLRTGRAGAGPSAKVRAV
jgi:guanylate kinase